MDAAPEPLSPAPVCPGPAPTLYPLQREGVSRFLSHTTTVEGGGPLRYILGWGTGCGKTAGALSSAEVLTRRPPASAPFLPRVLVVAPAVVRRHWLREVPRWAPSYARHCAAIEHGRERKLSAALAARRDAAYMVPLQVVSYDLLGQIDAMSWNLIILDELHHIAQPLSAQSKLVRGLLKANPRAHVLGLTATPFPTEVKQLWNPLRLLFGEEDWGKPSRTGDISWHFAQKYCSIEKTTYGTRAFGCKLENRPELRARLEGCCHFLTRDQLRDDLPPLDVQLLELPCSTPAQGRLKQTEELARWAQDKVCEGVQRIVVLVHYIDDAREILGELHGAYLDTIPVQLITGKMPPAKRDDTLASIAETEGTHILVATHGALSEGVRLMWAQEVAIADWPQSPGRLVQLMGRFQSVGSESRPHVSLVTTERDWAASEMLLARTRTMLALLGKQPTAEKIEGLMASRPEPAVADLLSQMLSEIRDTEAWADDTQGDGA